MLAGNPREAYPEAVAAPVPTFDAATNFLTRRGKDIWNSLRKDRESKKRARDILGTRRGLESFSGDVADLDRKIQNLRKITQKWRQRDEDDI